MCDGPFGFGVSTTGDADCPEVVGWAGWGVSVRIDHGYLPRWSGTRLEAAGNSYRVLWQSGRAPLSCSQSCAGEAAGWRKGRLTSSK